MGPATMAQSGVPTTGDQLIAFSIPAGIWHHSFVEIDNEIFSTVVLFLRLIQEGQLSVSGKRKCTSTCTG